jgi:hypothetical protein
MVDGRPIVAPRSSLIGGAVVVTAPAGPYLQKPFEFGDQATRLEDPSTSARHRCGPSL